MTKLNRKWEDSQVNLVNKAIKAAGSQSQLAMMIGVHRQIVSRWKLCQSQMSLESYLAVQQFVENEKR